MPSATENYLLSIWQRLTGGQALASESLSVVVPSVDVDTNLTGRITITTAGTKVVGPGVESDTGFLLTVVTSGKLGYYFEKNSTRDAKGFPFDSTSRTFLNVSNLNLVAFDSDANGTVLAWSKI